MNWNCSNRKLFPTKKFFGPHGWWARFTTNVLKKPNWCWFRDPNWGRYPINPFRSYHDFSKQETAEALDKLAQELYDSRNR